MKKKIYLKLSEPCHCPRMAYTIAFINNHPNFEGFCLCLDSFGTSILTHYSCVPPKQSGQISIRRQNLLFDQRPCGEIIWQTNKYFLGTEVYHSVESSLKAKQNISNKCVEFDLFEAIFFHISRYEEWIGSPKLNSWGTMIEKNQFLVRNHLHHTPVVDNLVLLLRQLITGRPYSKLTEIQITHDIDHHKKFTGYSSILNKTASHIYRLGGPTKYVKLLADYLGSMTGLTKDPFDNFDWLFVAGPVNKIVYLFVTGNHPLDPKTPHRSSIKKVAKIAQERGYTIGIHPSFASAEDQTQLIREKKLCEDICGCTIVDSRQHYLRFSFPHTISCLLQSGIKIDSSLGFNRYIGFRCGTGFGYYLYDFDIEGTSQLIEQPLAFMDGSCQYEAEARNISYGDLFSQFFNKNQYNTKIVVNFHNSYFDQAFYRGIPLQELYKNLIKSCA